MAATNRYSFHVTSNVEWIRMKIGINLGVCFTETDDSIVIQVMGVVWHPFTPVRATNYSTNILIFSLKQQKSATNRGMCYNISHTYVAKDLEL